MILFKENSFTRLKNLYPQSSSRSLKKWGSRSGMRTFITKTNGTFFGRVKGKYNIHESNRVINFFHI